MVALPDNSTLLPAINQNTKEHPPIYLNLNAETLELLRQAAVTSSQDGSAEKPSFVVNLFERSATIRFNDLEFHGSQYKEPGHVEVFLQDRHTEDIFQSQGCVGTRVTVKQQKPMKLVGELESVDLTRPAAQKILQLLMLKPHTAADLAAKTEESRSFVAATLAQVAKPSDQPDVYLLKEEFRTAGTTALPKTRPASRQSSVGSSYKSGTSSGSSSPVKNYKDRSTLPSSIPSSIPAGRTHSGDHSNRSSRSPNTNPSGTSNSSSSSSSPMPSLSTSDEDNRSDRSYMSRGAKRKTPAASSAVGTNKSQRPAQSQAPSYKRAKLDEEESRTIPLVSENDQNTDMFELARKFRDAYGEYRELYSLLQHHKSRPPKQVRKLMAMHHQLASWKAMLWSNARSKQVK